MPVREIPLTAVVDGEAVRCFELTTAELRVRCLSLGCYLNEISCPDREGQWKDVVVGFDVPEDFAGYTDGRSMYFGPVCGRVANRIKDGKFTLEGKEYTLATNNGPNALHGGIKGWDKKVWTVAGFGEEWGEPYVEFSLTSPDGEEGYPGEVKATIRYIVKGGALCIAYGATTDQTTVVNVTNHSYFNLSGDFTKNILGHQLELNCDRLTVVDAGAIPTGELRPVEGTPFDFTKPRLIGDGINADYEQIALGKGYDHNLVLREPVEGTLGCYGLNFCARVVEPTTGRKMEVFTSEPGVQFYTGNFMSADYGRGKGGVPLGHRTGFALETQHFPDSPNRPEFPSVVLRPNEQFSSRTVFRFSVA